MHTLLAAPLSLSSSSAPPGCRPSSPTSSLDLADVSDWPVTAGRWRSAHPAGLEERELDEDHEQPVTAAMLPASLQRLKLPRHCVHESLMSVFVPSDQ